MCVCVCVENSVGAEARHQDTEYRALRKSADARLRPSHIGHCHIHTVSDRIVGSSVNVTLVVTDIASMALYGKSRGDG